MAYTTTTRAPVSNLKAVSLNGAVRLTWTEPDYDGYTRTRIVLSESGLPTGAMDPSATVVWDATGTPGAAMQLTDTPLVNGTLYYYAAYTTDELGWSPPSFAIGVPHEPLRNLTATLGNNYIRLAWSMGTTGTAWKGTWIERKTNTWALDPVDPSAVLVAFAGRNLTFFFFFAIIETQPS